MNLEEDYIAEELYGREDRSGGRTRDHHRLLPASGVSVGIGILLKRIIIQKNIHLIRDINCSLLSNYARSI
jgi:hypothetical protein